MNFACPWSVLVDSLAKTPPREKVIYKPVTQKMRNHCQRVRKETAQRQRDALTDAILAILTPGTTLSTDEVARACHKSRNSVRRRLVDMESESLVARTAYINQFGLKALTWTAAPC